MEDLGFTERWLVVDIKAETGLDTWDGVEQICDQARPATFMHITGDRYRWEFQLGDGEDEADLITPAALGALLRPWTGRGDLDGLEIIRSASYTFRARLASRFRAGRVFLLGDAAHLTPPFIGQVLAAGLRDADNLAWKLAYVLTGRAGPDLPASYETERRPHARALIKKAVRIGWAMTGGQDRAATVRRIALATAVRSDRICQAMGSTATLDGRCAAVGDAARAGHRPAVGGVAGDLAEVQHELDGAGAAHAAGAASDPSTAPGRGVAVDLAEVEDQRPAVVQDAAGAARGGVAGQLAEVQRGGAERPVPNVPEAMLPPAAALLQLTCLYRPPASPGVRRWRWSLLLLT